MISSSRTNSPSMSVQNELQGMLSRVLLWLPWAPDPALTSYLALGKSYSSSELEVFICKIEA